MSKKYQLVWWSIFKLINRELCWEWYIYKPHFKKVNFENSSLNDIYEWSVCIGWIEIRKWRKT